MYLVKECLAMPTEINEKIEVCKKFYVRNEECWKSETHGSFDTTDEKDILEHQKLNDKNKSRYPTEAVTL